MSNFNSSIQFVIKGPIQENLGLNLFIDSHPDIGIPLFIKVDNPSTITNNFDLNILGSSEGQTNTSLLTLPLYIKSYNDSGIYLYIQTDEFGIFNFAKDLIIIGENLNIKLNVDLFIQNDTSEITYGMPLFARGLGINNGWYPNGNSIEFYIARENESLGSSMDLFLLSNESFSSNIDLITYGNDTYNQSLEMICGAGIDTFGKNADLYIHGY